MKFILFLLFSLSHVFAQDMDLNNLLKEYEISEELHKKTKKESSGNVIVFSRSDLDKMQAYTLNDVLKTLRLFTLQTTKVGMTALTKSGASQSAVSTVKIYINSHELNSATIGNAIAQYGKMGLYFIDHIEVYQAANSISFGNEPASMIIKLYTKDPSRENSSSVQLSADSRASSRFQFVDAKTFDEYSYLANVDISNNVYKKYNTNNSELTKDDVRGQLHLQLSKKNYFDIEVGLTQEEFDIFNGFGTSISGGDIKTETAYLRFTKYFEDNLKIVFDTSYESLALSNSDNVGITIFDNSVINSIDFEKRTYIQNALVEKKFIHENNELLIGAQIIHKKFTLEEFKNDNVTKAFTLGPTSLDIYMLYIENMYNLDENNLITIDAKVDYYENDLSKSSTENILRLGYVSLINDNWSFKIFGTKNYYYPIFSQTTFDPNYNINPDLQSTDQQIYTFETTYETDNLNITFGAIAGKVKNQIAFNQPTKQYINTNTSVSYEVAYINLNYIFDNNNKLKAEFFKAYADNYMSPGNGALIQLFNKIGSFDIYNEFIYRDNYTSSDGTKMPVGYDYTLGAIYPINKKTNIKLKGENLLNKASAVPINGINVPVIERRALLTMEYTF